MPRVQTCTAATVAGPVAGSPSLSGVPLCRRPCDTALRTARLLCSASWAGRRRRGGKSALVILPPLFRRSFSLSFLRSAVHSLYVRCCPCHLQWEALWGNHKRGVGGVRGGGKTYSFCQSKKDASSLAVPCSRLLLPLISRPHAASPIGQAQQWREKQSTRAMAQRAASGQHVRTCRCTVSTAP